MNRTVDVLVIGGSGAGISAAIAAVEQKQSVLLISKGKLGKNGNAIMAGGSFSIDGKSARAFGYEKADERVTQDVVFDNLVKEGYYLNNQKLVRQFVEGDCDQIASSRLEQLYDIKMTGIQKPLLLVRIPMPCEVSNVVSICDITLVSEVATMEALNEECLKQNKKLKVIVMAELGDLREGFWERDELVDACVGAVLSVFV